MTKHPSDYIIQKLCADEYRLLREVRLRALQDTPIAFGTTYAQDAALSDEQWRGKAAQWTDPARCATWVAMIDSQALGMVASLTDHEQTDRVWLCAMWVDPASRRCGIAQNLIDTLLGWAKTMDKTAVYLHVTEGNHAAQSCYERAGFELTGEQMPHAWKDGLIELEMCIRL